MTSDLLTKCSVCGADIHFPTGVNLVKCEYCLRVNDRPKSAETQREKMKLANQLRNMGDFAEAQRRYLNVLETNPEEHEARWGLLLCKYGVSYVESGTGKERLITCRRSLPSSIRDEGHYKIVLEQAPPQMRPAYEKDAEYIDYIQGQIRLLQPQTKPYDVFLCYKETAPGGGKTEDSSIAHGIYNDLTRSGYRVFFAPVSLKERAGANYEAAIFLAIETARVMLVLGTKKEYFESTWVRSEWRRYLEQIDLGDEKWLIPLFRNAADLPDIFQHRMIQGYDIQLPYMNYIKTRLNEVMPKEDRRFELVRIYLRRESFGEADRKLEEMLSDQPENPRIWFYKAMAGLHVPAEEELSKLCMILTENKDFQTALDFATGYFRMQLEEYAQAAEANFRAEELRKAQEANSKAEEERRAEEARQKAEKARQAGEARRKAEEARKEEKAQKPSASPSAQEEKAVREDAEAQYQMGLRLEGEHREDLAFPRLYQAAVQGHAGAQAEIGFCYTKGMGTAKNLEEGFRWTLKAAQQGNALAQFNLGVMYERGVGTRVDCKKAAEWYQKAADQDHDKAQYNLGRFYEHGTGVEKDLAKAARLYRIAAKQGHTKAQCNLGNLLQNSGSFAQLEEAAHWFRLSAEKGNSIAQYHLGNCFYEGRGTKWDYEEAIRWYRLAASSGLAMAQLRLGDCYYIGNGVRKNQAEAVKWYSEATKQENAEAIWKLGVCFWEGTGTKRDPSHAVSLFSRAADHNIFQAQYALARCLEAGEGIAKNRAEAMKWYRRLAESGMREAQKRLAYAYFRGEDGVEKSLTEAIKWAEIAVNEYEKGYMDLAYLHLPTDSAPGSGRGLYYADAYKYQDITLKAQPPKFDGELERFVGDGYADGIYGKKQNMSKAADWYLRAAKQGDANAQRKMAECCFYGKGTPKHAEEAVFWYQKAAEQGDTVAQLKLGDCYYNGWGVPQDQAAAVKWYQKAAGQ